MSTWSSYYGLSKREIFALVAMESMLRGPSTFYSAADVVKAADDVLDELEKTLHQPETEE